MFARAVAPRPRPRPRPFATVTSVACAFGLVGCEGPQSALAPAGRDAEIIANLFWGMAGGAAFIWLVVMGLALLALARARREHPRKRIGWLIVGGGAAFPTVVLALLLLYGLGRMPELLDHGRADGPQVEVTAEQWWWRIHYTMPDGARFELANEIRLPLNHRTAITLSSPDVIHSLWVPSLAGKMDAIPGRITRMAFEPQETGVFEGACAEYCGTAHAKMRLHVVVMEPEAFEAWARAQARPAPPPRTPLAIRGAGRFAALGCGACHTIRGTPADGRLGPDLTHVGDRTSLGAATLDNDVPGFERWIAHTEAVKPDVHMPSFGMLSSFETHSLAVYLDSLR